MIKVYAAGTEVTSKLENAPNSAISVAVGIGNTDIEVRSLKPLTKLYFDFTSSHDGSLTMLHWNGTALTVLTPEYDHTLATKSPGWVSWAKPTADAKDGSYYRYVFRITGASAPVSGALKFVGILFSSDAGLKNEFPNVADYLPTGDSSMIRFHIAAKDDLVQFYRQRGRKVYDTEAKQLTEFDFLDPTELSQAGKFLALSKLFFWLSDGTEDKYRQRSEDYEKRAYDAANLLFLSLDDDRDGVSDSGERMNPNYAVVSRG